MGQFPIVEKYNGWTNYETWNVKLWMDNSEGSDRYYRELAQQCYDESTSREYATRLEAATYTLADMLKDEYEEAAESILEAANQTASVWSDLLSAALSEVNWHEIAEHCFEDVDQSDDDDDDDSGQILNRYEVICGNIGSVYAGDDFSEASRVYDHYVDLSTSGQGSASNEVVTLLDAGEVTNEHEPNEQPETL